MIKSEWFGYYNVNVKYDYKKIIIAADTAIQAKEHSDYSCFLVGGVTQNNHLHILQMAHGKWEYPDLKSVALSVYNNWQFDKRTTSASALFIEDKASGQQLVQDFKKLGLPVRPVEVTKDKLTRVEEVLDYIAAGLVQLPENRNYANNNVLLTECEAFSRDMMWAASRYTEAKLEKICTEFFVDIDKNTVDMVDNFDNTMKEPALLPVNFPSVLVNANTGIAAGMASSICSFNLEEVCKTTIELIKNPKHDVTETLLAPDFSGGGLLIYNKENMEEIYRTGRGGFKVRARYSFDKSNNCIEVTEIPYSTTIEAIIDKIIELAKAGKIDPVIGRNEEIDRVVQILSRRTHQLKLIFGRL